MNGHISYDLLDARAYCDACKWVHDSMSMLYNPGVVNRTMVQKAIGFFERLMRC